MVRRPVVRPQEVALTRATQNSQSKETNIHKYCKKYHQQSTLGIYLWVDIHSVALWDRQADYRLIIIISFLTKLSAWVLWLNKIIHLLVFQKRCCLSHMSRDKFCICVSTTESTGRGSVNNIKTCYATILSSFPYFIFRRDKLCTYVCITDTVAWAAWTMLKTDTQLFYRVFCPPVFCPHDFSKHPEDNC